MQRRQFLGALALTAASLRLPRLAAKPPTRIAFGSCLMQDREQPIWRTIVAQNPDLFIFLGDNIYADTDDMSVMAARYRQLGDNADFQWFRERVPIAATWDDHDFGRNDAGREYPYKEESKNLMLNFFKEPKESERRQRPGVYTSLMLGQAPMQVQILLLDLRWFRTALEWRQDSGYVPIEDPDAELLGEAQWQWLENELRKPAQMRILASSIQLAAVDHRWEKWSNFPREKARLLDLLDRLDIQNICAISGDMHYGEISRQERPSGAWLYDITASGLNRSEAGQNLPNSNRLQFFDESAHFGLLEIDWNLLPQMTASIIDVNGTTRLQSQVPLATSLLSNL